MGLTWLMEGTQTSGKVFFYANFPHSTYFQKNKDVPKESVHVFCETIYTKSDPNPDRLRDCGQRGINEKVK